MNPIKVVKRDGVKEPFDPAKITQVVNAAGLDFAQAQIVSDRVVAWVKKQKVPEISSLQIRDQITVVLETVDKQVANFFRWYQKTKDKPQ
ncbi:hypothetical protein A2397_06300 [Candidatus Amesbacteria bacterium RIFOXYB1_FULL_44_23]|uniref:ATP-cone domain-containing protein n=1 Tax=Candidatus Amesbacteria bacterium RIFOXYB1_FULL_44_23 TaxID=1797263 RepID=A0A1F4ZWS4_9BACT|nr:MAG: hypothetical protein A2397_06300 [Candidatus Amesbacteria bacterium RIFOXYB1_FULL_44_23]